LALSHHTLSDHDDRPRRPTTTTDHDDGENLHRLSTA
jgi:hypothetical protein